MTLGETEALPSVTVIVPMYNEEAHIAACIDGLWKQTYRGEMEVLVVDGGSTDRSPEIVGELARSHPSVRLVANPRRRPAAAANIGVAAARGDVLCFLSAHGEPSPTYVEASVDLLRDGCCRRGRQLRARRDGPAVPGHRPGHELPVRHGVDAPDGHEPAGG